MQLTLSRTALVCSIALAGCDLGNIGGANEGQKKPGNMDDGVALSQGDIAVSPRGTSFLARVGDTLIRGDVDGDYTRLPQLGKPERLAFAPGRDVVYVIHEGKDGPELAAHDALRDRQLWATALPSAFAGDHDLYDDGRPWLKVASDDRYVVLVGEEEIYVYDTATGEQAGGWWAADPIVDVDVAADGSKIYAAFETSWHDGTPRTPFSVMQLPSLEATSQWIPNCADEVVLDDARGKYAFMAPTSCQQDPVSVIDLDTGMFVRNLPGFGPVALATQGERAVAFIDLDNLDESLFEDGDPMPRGDRQYHLMLIDTQTLHFETVELGDSLPRYAPTPDGRLLLVDAAAWYDDERVRIFDLETGEFAPIYGPDVRLENFVVTRDSQRAFLVSDGAYELLLPDRLLSSLPLGIIPTNLNITADDRWLLLQDDRGPVHVWDVQNRRISAMVGPTHRN
jgi:hypothetical protein